MGLPGSSISATVQPLARARPLARAPRPAVSLPLRRPRPATSSRWRSATAPLPATNLIRQRSTPVWLAIWRTWTGFANSQLRCANFPALIYIYMRTSPLLPPWSRCSDRRKSFGPSAPIAYATYVSPPDEAIAWPGRRCWIWLLSGPMHRSCKSPRARILVLGTSGAHWPARWPQFELTERVAKS